MKYIYLVQRTPEWHQWRKGGVTASEAPVILGRSPYKTPWRLWAEKTGRMAPPDFSRNPNVQRGVKLEDYVREQWAIEHLEVVEPACAEWDQDPVFRASFDGLTSEELPVEIKCPSESVFADVLTRGRDSDAFKLYEVQVQHQLLVADAPKGWLVFFCNGAMKEFEIARDEAVIAEIIEKGRAFHKAVVEGVEPPMDPERDVYVPSDASEKERWVAAARSFSSLQNRINALKAEIAALEEQQAFDKEEFKILMKDFASASCAGVSVKHVFAKGRVDYKAALKDACGSLPSDAELERFRSASSERWSFSLSPTDLPEGADEASSSETTAAASVIPDSDLWW